MVKFNKEEKIKLAPYHARFKKDIDAFAKFYFSDLLVYDTPQFHVDIYKFLQESKRLVLASPRGHGKSTLCSIIYPLWLAFYGDRKDIVIISASEDLAVNFLREIKRQIETSDRLLSMFGDVRSDKWTETQIILSNEQRTTIRARGAEAQIRGFRPDCIILDDIETNESVESEDRRSKITNWIFKDCLNTLMPEGQLVMIGTILNNVSVLKTILEMENNWMKKIYRAYIDGKEEEGYELWKEIWSHKRLQERKEEIGSWRFYAEYMNNPMSDETLPIKDSMIRYWDTLPTQYSAVISVDPAYSEDKTADYKVASLVYIDGQLNRYLVNYIRTHAPTGEFQDAIINLWQQNKGFITGIGVPNSGVEKSFYESFIRRCNERRLYPPVMELKNTFTDPRTSISIRNKKARIIACLQPLFENGKYFIGKHHDEAREELLLIGNSIHDDIIDSMCYAEQLVQPVTFEEKKQPISVFEEFNNENVFANYGMG